MKIKTNLHIEKDELVNNLYIETGIEYKEIYSLLIALEKYLYSKDLLEYD